VIVMPFKANASQLRSLGTQLRRAQPDVYKQVRKAVREEARIVAASAREKASWSTRIPATVRVSALGVNTAVVRAGNDKTAPHAKPFEHAGHSGTFRHPVHGDPRKTRSEWAWVTQQARPFLHPAAWERLPETVRHLGQAVITAVDELRFGGD
jgi:hypothetical protein